MNTITPLELFQMTSRGQEVDLIDVRTPKEYREIHVTFAKNVPLDQLNPSHISAGRDGNRPLYVICRSGARGEKACEKLLAAGCHCVVNVQGGTTAWDQACLPVVRGKKAISLERQVRMIAGSLTVVGAVLAVTVEPLWALMSAAMGAGLAHAGLTDSCAMGMMLAKMPWNKTAPPSPATVSTNTCSN